MNRGVYTVASGGMAALARLDGREPVATATSIEQLDVLPDTTARVVLNERTGTVIIGTDVRVMPVGIAHGSLNLTVKTDFGVSQPAPFSQGGTVVVPDTTLKVEEGRGRTSCSSVPESTWAR
jgi:flagellar basal body P-ring protein FlgI